MNTIITYIKNLCENHRNRDAAARRRNATLRAAEDLYLRDYNGALYLYFAGRPILPAASITGDKFKALDDARKTLATFDVSRGR